ncbi:MAG: hypothetical protein DWH79_11025 [Planctomycetota bacterium]|nr:MAG: hypothetical protein DWH79_11025 [Planctomycetota bacterium]
MLHYSCDVCKRPIDTDHDIRHVVKIEVFPAVDDATGIGGGTTEEADHLEEMHDILERIGESDDELPFDDGTRSMRFDLCDSCRQRFVKNPLGGKPGKHLDFSNN